MRKLLMLLLVILFTFSISSSFAENSVSEYKNILLKQKEWNVKDVSYSIADGIEIPTLFNQDAVLSSYSCTLFGDDTGEVYLFYDGYPYRMFLAYGGDIVLLYESNSGWGIVVLGHIVEEVINSLTDW